MLVFNWTSHITGILRSKIRTTWQRRPKFLMLLTLWVTSARPWPPRSEELCLQSPLMIFTRILPRSFNWQLSEQTLRPDRCVLDFRYDMNLIFL